jgi:L-asparaginase/Glu-tRNA(Gln) amidotransferase subunit D
MAGRVEADAESFELPYEVLVARDADVIDTYQIVKLPRIIVIARGGTISYTQRYAPYETLKEEVNRARATK